MPSPGWRGAAWNGGSLVQVAECKCLEGYGEMLWTAVVAMAVWLLVLLVVGFFSLRYRIQFERKVKQNRDAGLYNDPEFKRRVRRFMVLRLSLTAALVLSGVPAIWAIRTGLAIETWFPVWIIFFIPISIGLSIVDLLWHRLMTKSIERAPKAES